MRTLDSVRLAPIWMVLAIAANSVHGQTMRLPTPVALPKRQENLDLVGQPGVPKQHEPRKFALPCSIFPTRDACRTKAGETDRITFVNTFYRTYSSISFFNQVKSIYNGSSASATVSADLTSLNFTNGMQVNVGTNLQAGSTGAPTTSSGAMPTLSATAAGQATQNMLYGGTLVASALYPFIAIGSANVNNAGAFGLTVDMAAREGIDIQNFKSGTNTSVTSPPSHASALIEGYVWYNSTNLTSDSSTFAGALFVGDSYGYSHTSHDYSRDYGFGGHVNRPIGQVSAGILINNVAKISVSRGFGPSQTYIDSTSMLQRTVNNFKSWSIGVTYQSTRAKSSE